MLRWSANGNLGRIWPIQADQGWLQRLRFYSVFVSRGAFDRLVRTRTDLGETGETDINRLTQFRPVSFLLLGPAIGLIGTLILLRNIILFHPLSTIMFVRWGNVPGSSKPTKHWSLIFWRGEPTPFWYRINTFSKTVNDEQMIKMELAIFPTKYIDY